MAAIAVAAASVPRSGRGDTAAKHFRFAGTPVLSKWRP
jgi:hypothetical protein